MNLMYLQYIVTIVECEYNLTLAAEELHISQPALSNFVKRYEEEIGEEIFVRKKRKLCSLTNIGNVLYRDSLGILESYYAMMGKVEALSHFKGGVIRVGINPVMLSLLFTELFTRLVSENPNIKFELIEKGSNDLVPLLEANDIDLAFIFHPNSINLNLYHEVIIYEESIMGFMNAKHPLVNKITSDNKLAWKELDNHNMILLDQQFMIRKYILEQYKENKIQPRIALESSSWDFLLENTRINEAVTFLPSPIKDHTNLENLVYFDMEEPIPWRISLIYPKKEAYSNLEQHVIDSIVNYFVKDREIFKFRNLDENKSDTLNEETLLR